MRSFLGAVTILSVLLAGLTVTGGPAIAAGAAAPAKVRGLVVSSGVTHGDRVRLTASWRAVPDATRYRISWSLKKSMRDARSRRSRTTSHAFDRLRAGRTYCFQVRAERLVRKQWRSGKPSAVVCRATPRPVSTVRPVGVLAQRVESTATGRRVALTLRWQPAARATVYDVQYAPGGDIARSPSRRVVRVAHSGNRLHGVVVRGLLPGRIYCFQIRGRASTGVGAYGPRHCKQALPAARALQPTSFGVKIATFNICGGMRKCHEPWSWPVRRPLIKQHILASGADVVAVQESQRRVPDLEDDLRPSGFVKGCSAHGAQAVFVRSSVYSLVWRGSGAARFVNDASHGACWVRLRHRATGAHVVVTSLHLKVGRGAAESEVRRRQTSEVLARLEQQYGKVGASGTPPFLITGDFNSHRSHGVDAPRVRLGQVGFHDAYDVSATYQAPLRNSANSYRVVPKFSPMWGSHVDRVFVPPGATVTGWRTVTRMNGGRYVAPMPSDHHPVTMTVYLPHSGGLLGGLLG